LARPFLTLQSFRKAADREPDSQVGFLCQSFERRPAIGSGDAARVLRPSKALICADRAPASVSVLRERDEEIATFESLGLRLRSHLSFFRS
jgi:hypothetical protein